MGGIRCRINYRTPVQMTNFWLFKSAQDYKTESNRLCSMYKRTTKHYSNEDTGTRLNIIQMRMLIYSAACFIKFRANRNLSITKTQRVGVNVKDTKQPNSMDPSCV